MAAPIILAEKLRRPELAGLSRPRLERPLLAGAGPGLDLVVAPPGSGKTTLLARVAASATDPVAWYRVTADDASEAAFVAHLAKALEAAVGLPNRPADGEYEPVTDLLARLDEAHLPSCFLILDDLHEISGSPAERALERFVALRPPRLRVLIGSRRQPGINVSRLRVSGLLREITGDDLRFRSWEVEELFVGVFGQPLSPESAAALTRRTGGWAAALQLFHLATVGRSAAERAQVIVDLGGRSRLIRSYLTRNVLADLPEERRKFLVRTSTLGTLTGELCDALLGITGSALILDDLEQRQMFTTSDDDGHTFRYHEVLRTHLELALVEEYGPAGARDWYSRSAALLEAAGEQRAAVRAHARAEDWPAVARLVREWKIEAGADPPLPARMVETDPWLALVEARRLLRTGSIVAAVAAFRRAEILLDEPEFQEACRQERALAAGWAAQSDTEVVPLSAQRHWTGRIRSATRSAWTGVAVTATANPEDRLAGAISALLAGDLRRAGGILATLTAASSSPTVGLLARLGQAVVEMMSGSAGADTADRWGRLAADADAGGLPWLGRLARGLLEVAMMSQDPQDWRLAACAALPDDCDQAGDAWGGALLRLAGAVAQQVFRGVDASALYADASVRFADLDAPVLSLWADALGLFVTGRPGIDTTPRSRVLAGEARKRGIPGVEAMALAATAVFGAVPDPQVARSADELAGRCGLRAAVVALLPPSAHDQPASLGMHFPPAVGTHPPSTPGSGPVLPASGAADAGSMNGSASVNGAASMPGPGPITGAVSVPGSGSTLWTDPAAPVTAAHSPGSDSSPIPAQRLPQLQIHCFGGFRLELDGAPVDLSSLRRRSYALLRLMAQSPGKDLHRESLIEVLWPEADLAAGTRRLQVAISSVRQVLEHAGISGAETLLRHGDAYQLCLPPGSTVDVLEFEAAVRAADTAARRGDIAGAIVSRDRALALYRGDLLPEDGSTDPIAAARERLRLTAAGVAAALAGDRARTDDPDAAMTAARRAIELDPYQDPPWRLITDLYEAAGDVTAAERTRQEHLRIQAELGVN